MGKIGRFFKKIGNKIWGGIKKVGKFVGKIAKPVVKVGKFATGLLAKAPGAVGTVAGLINKGLTVADAAISQLPEGKMKDKMQGMAEQVKQGVAQGHERAADFAERAKTANDRIQQTVNAGKTLVDGAKNLMAKPQII